MEPIRQVIKKEGQSYYDVPVLAKLRPDLRSEVAMQVARILGVTAMNVRNGQVVRVRTDIPIQEGTLLAFQKVNLRWVKPNHNSLSQR